MTTPRADTPTYTVHVLVRPLCEVAVMRAVPSETPVTTPSSTVATSGLSLSQAKSVISP